MEDFALPAIRFVHYAVALQVFGVTVFEALLAPRDLRRHLDAPAAALAMPCAWMLLASSIAWLAATAANFGNGWADAINPSVLLPVLTATEFGRVWIWQLGFAMLLAVWITFARGKWLVPALLSTLVLGSLGLVGHATIGQGLLGLLNRASQALHLLSSAFWVGSLLPLLFCLRALQITEHEASAQVALHRFSGLGHLAVAIVIATGVTNGLLIMGGLPRGWGQYQWVLLAKVLIVLLMVGLAVVNRYVFVPKLGRGGLGGLWRGTVAEIVLTAGVLLLVSWLGVLPPA